MDIRTIILLVAVIGAAHARSSKSRRDLENLRSRIRTLEDKQIAIEHNLAAVMHEMDYRRLTTMQAEDPTLTMSNLPTLSAFRHKPRDCQDIFDMGYFEDGVRTIGVDGAIIPVFCEDEGWTVMQKRFDGSLSFRQSLEKYTIGFGDVSGEHWLGLDTVHYLTATGDWTLRIELESFDGDTAWAEYSGFSIGPGPHFELHFGRYHGTAGNSFIGLDKNTILRNMRFTTYDNDQDEADETNCADIYGGGGWWYNNCMYATTTGEPYNGGLKSIYWHMWKGHDSLKSATMKIKRS